MINLVGSTLTQNNAGVNYTTIVGTMPSGATAGMLLEAFVARQGNLTDSCTPPAGWTTVFNGFGTFGSSVTHIAVFYKIAVGGDDLTFTLNSLGNHGRLEINAWDGFNTGTPISVIGAEYSGISASPVLPSVTAVSSNSVLRSVLATKGGYSNTANGVVASGFTAITKSTTQAISYGLTTGSAYKTVPSGATGSVTWTDYGTGSNYLRGFNYLINPSAGTVSAIDDPIAEGTSFNYTQSGMGALSGITTDKTGVTVSSVTATSALLSGWTEGGLYPELPSAVQFEFTGGTGSALVNSNITAPAGYTKLTIASPLFIANTLAQAILDETGRTIATSDVFYYDPYDDLVITSDTDYEVTSEGTIDIWLRVSSGIDAGKMFQFAVEISEEIVVVTPVTTQSATYKLQARRI